MGNDRLLTVKHDGDFRSQWVGRLRRKREWIRRMQKDTRKISLESSLFTVKVTQKAVRHRYFLYRSQFRLRASPKAKIILYRMIQNFSIHARLNLRMVLKRRGCLKQTPIQIIRLFLAEMTQKNNVYSNEESINGTNQIR